MSLFLDLSNRSFLTHDKIIFGWRVHFILKWSECVYRTSEVTDPFSDRHVGLLVGERLDRGNIVYANPGNRLSHEMRADRCARASNESAAIVQYEARWSERTVKCRYVHVTQQNVTAISNEISEKIYVWAQPFVTLVFAICWNGFQIPDVK